MRITLINTAFFNIKSARPDIPPLSPQLIPAILAKDAAGIAIPKEIVLGVILVKGAESKKEIDGYEIRMSLDGIPIRGMHAIGVVGHVVQQALPPGSKELLSMFKKESALYLKEIELAQLSK